MFEARQTMNGREKWAQANTVFFRMHHITDIYFVGGFGTMTWVSVDEYSSAKPDRIATVDSRKTLQVALLLRLAQPPCQPRAPFRSRGRQPEKRTRGREERRGVGR